MIKITIEMWPRGYEQNKKKIAEMTIVNDGSGTKTKGNYYFNMWLKRFAPWKSGKIENFSRGSKNIYYLIQQCLNEALK